MQIYTYNSIAVPSYHRTVLLRNQNTWERQIEEGEGERETERDREIERGERVGGWDICVYDEKYKCFWEMTIKLNPSSDNHLIGFMD